MKNTKLFVAYDEESINKMYDGIEGMFDQAIEDNGGNFYTGDHVKVTITMEYCPEDK